MKILVVRFKQIGDSVLASPICNSLKKTYPDSEIDYVVYEHISPLFEKHPYIDNVISITKDEQKNPFKYLAKVWKVNSKKYDIVIDIMSTPKSEVFTFLSLGAKYRIGRRKPKRGYTYTHKIDEPSDTKDKVDKFLKMLKPLEDDGVNVKYDHDYSISISDEEKRILRERMEDSGVDFGKLVFAFAINSRRPNKIWKREYMMEVIKHCINKYDAQIIFYYSPAEKTYAKETHEIMEWNKNIFSNIETKSIRELAMLLSNCDMFVGNEGGPRHIAQGLDIPSLAIFSPSSEKKEWLSNANDRHQGIEIHDIGVEKYFDIKPSHVIEQLDNMINKYVEKR
jgi:heptosyltransferase-2